MSVRTISNLIDLDTWNQAGWAGTLFGGDSEPQTMPVMGLLFENEKAGRKIFSDWLSKLGRADEFDLLRVSIIEGEIPGQDPGYTVFIGHDPENHIAYYMNQAVDLSQSPVIYVGRFNRMYPRPDSPFLDRFKKSYELKKNFSLFPAFGDSARPAPDTSLAIKKKIVRFLRAEQLTKDDVEYVVLQAKG